MKSGKMMGAKRGAPGANQHIGAVKPTVHSGNSQSPRPSTGGRKSPAQTKQA